MDVNLVTTMCNEHNKLYTRCKKDKKMPISSMKSAFPFLHSSYSLFGSIIGHVVRKTGSQSA